MDVVFKSSIAFSMRKRRSYEAAERPVWALKAAVNLLMLMAACFANLSSVSVPEEAIELLKTTSLPLREIAGIVGYKYYSRFSTLFREQFRVMPSESRKRE